MILNVLSSCVPENIYPVVTKKKDYHLMEHLNFFPKYSYMVFQASLILDLSLSLPVLSLKSVDK